MDNKGQDVICEELNDMRNVELAKKERITTKSLNTYAKAIKDHISICKKCQPERLNPEASKEDAIV
jgi:hypothetical protein